MINFFKAIPISAILVLLVLLQFPPQVSVAQSTNPVYWRYDAPGRLSKLSVVDIDQDHLGEFLVVAENSQLMLVGADGRPLWDSPFQTDEPIEVVISADLLDRIDTSDEIVVGTQGHLILLDRNGHAIWQRPLR